MPLFKRLKSSMLYWGNLHPKGLIHNLSFSVPATSIKSKDLLWLSITFSNVFLIILNTCRYISVGRFFYSPSIKKPQALGNGLQSWRGFYQSIKPTQMGLSLNIGRIVHKSHLSISFYKYWFCIPVLMFYLESTLLYVLGRYVNNSIHRTTSGCWVCSSSFRTRYKFQATVWCRSS